MIGKLLEVTDGRRRERGIALGVVRQLGEARYSSMQRGRTSLHAFKSAGQQLSEGEADMLKC